MRKREIWLTVPFYWHRYSVREESLFWLSLSEFTVHHFGEDSNGRDVVPTGGAHIDAS